MSQAITGVLHTSLVMTNEYSNPIVYTSLNAIYSHAALIHRLVSPKALFKKTIYTCQLRTIVFVKDNIRTVAICTQLLAYLQVS